MLFPGCTWATAWGWSYRCSLFSVGMLLYGADPSLMLQSQILSRSDTSPFSMHQAHMSSWHEVAPVPCPQVGALWAVRQYAEPPAPVDWPSYGDSWVLTWVSWLRVASYGPWGHTRAGVQREGSLEGDQQPPDLL